MSVANSTLQPQTGDSQPAILRAACRPLRVLLISHTCQSRSEGQPKAFHLARMSEIRLKVITPERWLHYGAWRRADIPSGEDALDLEVAKVRWPWAGPAQFYLHWYPQLKRILRDFRPDVIDLWEEPWGLVSVQACRLRNRFLPHARIVSETEQNINKTLPFPFEHFRSYTLRNADYAVGRSAEAVKILRDKGYKGPAEVVPNAVDDELFRPLDRDACREQLGLKGFVVGYVGRLVEEKGLADLLDAIGLCPESVRLVLVGCGPLQSELELRADRPDLKGRVDFLGARPLEQLPRVMNALDVLAVPSRTTSRWKEQFGRVIIEAHACGVPVVGSDSGAIPDVIGQAGRVVPERDPAALAGALTELAARPDLARSLGLSGRRQVEQQYTWQRVAQRMAAIYLKVADVKP